MEKSEYCAIFLEDDLITDEYEMISDPFYTGPLVRERVSERAHSQSWAGQRKVDLSRVLQVAVQ